MIPVSLLNPKFAIEFAARGVRTSGSGHWNVTNVARAANGPLQAASGLRPNVAKCLGHEVASTLALSQPVGNIMRQ